MKQSKLGSLVESLCNLSIGFVIAMITQAIIYPMFGIHISTGTNMAIVAIMTIVSLIRSYFVRRLFNSLHGKI